MKWAHRKPVREPLREGENDKMSCILYGGLWVLSKSQQTINLGFKFKDNQMQYSQRALTSGLGYVAKETSRGINSFLECSGKVQE